MIHFQHHFLFDSSSMTSWCKRMDEKGVEQLLKETSNAGTGSYGLEGKPYDGHTAADTLERIEKLTGIKLKEVFVDRGYRGNDYKGESEVHIDKARRGRTPQAVWKKLKQRVRIEPVIRYLKQENRMGINRLGGLLDDNVNSLRSGAGFNFRKLLRVLLSLFQLLIYGHIAQNHSTKLSYHF